MIASISTSSRLDVVGTAVAPLARVVVDDHGFMLINQDGMTQYATPPPTH